MKKNTGNKPLAPAGSTPKTRTKEDIDDLVHSPQEELLPEAGEMDPDDLVHQPVKKDTSQIDVSLADPDDLVHDTNGDDDDGR